MSVTVAQVRPHFLPEQRLPVGEMMPSVPAPAHPSWTGPPWRTTVRGDLVGARSRGAHTSVGDHLHVRPDHVQVDAMLLLPDDDSPPQATVGCAAIVRSAVPKQVRAVSRHVLGSGHWGVVCSGGCESSMDPALPPRGLICESWELWEHLR